MSTKHEGQSYRPSWAEVFSMDRWLHSGLALHFPGHVDLQGGVRRVWAQHCTQKMFLKRFWYKTLVSTNQVPVREIWYQRFDYVSLYIWSCAVATSSSIVGYSCWCYKPPEAFPVCSLTYNQLSQLRLGSTVFLLDVPKKKDFVGYLAMEMFREVVPLKSFVAMISCSNYTDISVLEYTTHY